MISNEFDIQTTISKFIIKLVHKKVLTHGSHQFDSQEKAEKSPLAKHLLSFLYVKKVYISANFIALECPREVDWKDHQEAIKQEVISFLESGGLLFSEKNKLENFVEWYTEATPNPAVLKFVASKILFDHDYEFIDIQDSQHSDLAKELFNFQHVEAIFFSQNFVSITKKDSFEWIEIKDELKQFIKNYVASGNLLVKDAALVQDNQSKKSINHLKPDEQKIVSILEEHIKPLVASDGGNITFQEYNPASKIVSLLLQGACSGCPSSSVTLKEGIEKILKQLMPGKIEQVVAYN